jgi:uncharacterized repeat protein (TIGR01451 family)
VTSPPDSASVPLPAADPSITVHKHVVDAAPSYTVGETIHYVVDATNTGNVTLTHVEVTDTLIPTLDCGPFDGVLSPGETVSCTGSLVVTADEAAAGEVVNHASATADPPSGPSVGGNDSVKTTVHPASVTPPPGNPPAATPTTPHTGFAFTGSNTWDEVTIALLLLGVGAVALVVARKRRRRPGGR